MWSDHAACKGLAHDLDYGPIWWGTARQPQEQIDKALAVCGRCPVTSQCADELPDNTGLYYIKGGKRRPPT